MNYTDTLFIEDSRVEVLNYLPEIGLESIQEEILEGLKASGKYILPKFFYDKRGSELFELITHLEEYYPTRCEKEILSSIVSRSGIDFSNLDIVELGSGDASKIKTIFSQIPADILSSVNYYPVDISHSAIVQSIHDIHQEYGLNCIKGTVNDFHNHQYVPRRGQRLFCFLGNTIGNFSKDEVNRFITCLGKEMKKGDTLLLGTDMVKDPSIIERAYNDELGVTAAFNKNILNVVNAQIHSDFKTSDFEHIAFYNKKEDRIEMHLKAKHPVLITVGCTEEVLSIKAGETIHTENSCKYTPERFKQIAACGGMKIKDVFTDAKGWFSLLYLVKV